MSKATDISDTAAQWLVRLEGQSSPGIWDAFQQWMDADPRHRAAFIRLRVAWNQVDVLKGIRPPDGTIDADLLATTRIQPRSIAARGLQPVPRIYGRRTEDLVMPERRRVFAIAAAIAAAGVIAWFGAYHLGWKSFETGVGGREKLQLADGSTVDLNTNTEINVRISGSRRDITLSRGEALFHVAHDSKRPFYVTAGGAVVRAVGTEFSVRIRDPEHVDILVAEGRVAVGAPGTEANFENPSLLAAAQMVSGGEAASVQRNSVAVHSVPAQDIPRRLAWTGGYLAFQGDTLNDMVKEFNRYNQRQITIVDPSIVNIKFGGHFRTTDPDSFVAALKQAYHFRVQVGDDKGDIHLAAGGEPP